MITTWNDIKKKNCEHRDIEIHRTGLERPSSVIWYFDCPWCGDEIKTYLWSFAGSGKRCDCGAIFSFLGGYKLKELHDHAQNGHDIRESPVVYRRAENADETAGSGRS